MLAEQHQLSPLYKLQKDELEMLILMKAKEITETLVVDVQSFFRREQAVGELRQLQENFDSLGVLIESLKEEINNKQEPKHES